MPATFRVTFKTFLSLMLSSFGEKLGVSSHRRISSPVETTSGGIIVGKASGNDTLGRFREIVSDPLNLLIERHPMAGAVQGKNVFLHNGISVPLMGSSAYYNSFSDILVINRGVHEPLEEFCFQTLLQKLDGSPTMLELGAYWAHYSMWFQSKFSSGKCILVEPETDNMEVGKRNFAANGFDGTFINGLVGPQDFVVDDFLKEKEIQTLDILHSDIQGAESDMLDGASCSLQEGKIRYSFISTHSEALHSACVKKLKNAGYRIEVSSNFDGHTTSSDGLVVASHPDSAPLFDGFEPMGRGSIAVAKSNKLLEYLNLSIGTI